jgi:hypothetical protein
MGIACGHPVDRSIDDLSSLGRRSPCGMPD